MYGPVLMTRRGFVGGGAALFGAEWNAMDPKSAGGVDGMIDAEQEKWIRNECAAWMLGGHEYHNVFARWDLPCGLCVHRIGKEGP